MPDHQNDDLANSMDDMPDRRITGETDGHSVFRITFEDGCIYIGFTAGLIVDRVAHICGNSRPEPPQGWLRNRREAKHASRMTKTIECFASGLGRRQAYNIREFLIRKTADENEKGNDTSGIAGECQIWQEEQEERIGNMALYEEIRARQSTEIENL